MKTPNGRSHSYSAARPLSTRRSPPPSSISPSSVVLPIPGSPTISRIPVDRLSSTARSIARRSPTRKGWGADGVADEGGVADGAGGGHLTRPAGHEKGRPVSGPVTWLCMPGEAATGALIEMQPMVAPRT